MRRALQVTLLALAVVVVAFAATWATLPTGEIPSRGEQAPEVALPAKLFTWGDVTDCPRPKQPRLYCPDDTISPSDLQVVERRVKAVFGGAAAVVVLVGLAVGVGRR